VGGLPAGAYVFFMLDFLALVFTLKFTRFTLLFLQGLTV
jgi:hypothetical protein